MQQKMDQKCGYYHAYGTYFSKRRVNDAGEPKINVFSAFWNVSEVKYWYYNYKLLGQRKKKIPVFIDDNGETNFYEIENSLISLSITVQVKSNNDSTISSSLKKFL